MNKLLLVVFILSVSSVVRSQENNADLIERFRNEKKEMIERAKFDFRRSNKFNSKSPKLTIKKEIPFNQIDYYSDDLLIILKEDDSRANSASNIDALQNGEVGGISIDGTGVEIMVMDGGRALEDHVEFIDKNTDGSKKSSRLSNLESNLSEPLSISNHATAVSGFIAGRGAYIFNIDGQDGIIPKGVLPKAEIKNASFSYTANGDNLAKILLYQKFISNHSYGTNLGWDSERSDGKIRYLFSFNPSNLDSSSQTLYGAYLSTDKKFDEIVYREPRYTIVKSAGNEYGTGPSAGDPIYKFVGGQYELFEERDVIPAKNCESGAYCISAGSLGKNIIVVGAIDIPKTTDYKVSEANQVIHSSYSSAGPRKDGAIKPDIVAVGTRLIYPAYDLEEDGSYKYDDYGVGSGTSYSSPKVAGAVGALTQLNRFLKNDQDFYFYSDEVKALLLHTTKEAGDFEGPDNVFGWGLLDAKSAAETLINTSVGKSILERNEKINGVDYEKIVTAKSGQELKATITWVDPAADYIDTKTIKEIIADTSSKLVNDLDLRIVDLETNEVYEPWKLDLRNPAGAAIKGDNTVDNIEQITIKQPIAGRKYKIKVTNKGDLVNDNQEASNQTYTLLVTGADEAFSKEEEDTLDDHALIIYPTLVKDYVIINVKTVIEGIQVFSLTGDQYIRLNKLNQNKVDLSNLKSGVYVLQVKLEGGKVVNQKFIKE